MRVTRHLPFQARSAPPRSTQWPGDWSLWKAPSASHRARPTGGAGGRSEGRVYPWSPPGGVAQWPLSAGPPGTHLGLFHTWRVTVTLWCHQLWRSEHLSWFPLALPTSFINCPFIKLSLLSAFKYSEISVRIYGHKVSGWHYWHLFPVSNSVDWQPLAPAL